MIAKLHEARNAALEEGNQTVADQIQAILDGLGDGGTATTQGGGTGAGDGPPKHV